MGKDWGGVRSDLKETILNKESGGEKKRIHRHKASRGKGNIKVGVDKMKIHELIDMIAKEITSEKSEELAKYLKESLDDNGSFLRSKYCRRREGLIADREIGDIAYVICGYRKTFKETHIEYRKHGQIRYLTDFQAQIMWGTEYDSLGVCMEICFKMGYKHVMSVAIK